MYPFQMEQLLRNIDARVARIEQFLPSLATKEEAATLATKEDLRTGLEDAGRHALMLNEATRDDIRLLAEHMLAMRAQLDRMDARFERVDARLDRIEHRRT